MMINCPRCGFSQPKDKYCAQCGLDIETYRAPEVPLFRQVFGHPFFQISVVLLVAVGSGLYVYKHNRQEIQERVSFFRQGIQYNRNMNSSLPPAGPIGTEGQVVAGDEDVPSELTTTEEGSSPTAALPPAIASGALNASKSSDNPKLKIRIQYVEVNEAALSQIYSDARNSGQFNSLGDHIAGVWLQGKKKVASMRGWQVLSKEEKAFNEGHTLQFFAGLRGNDPENDLGLTTYMEISSFDPQGLHGHLEVVRAWREPPASGETNTAIQRKFYPTAVDVPTDSLLFIAGALPRGTGMDTDPYLTNIEPFKLLKNKNRSTEFLIVVDFEKSTP